MTWNNVTESNNTWGNKNPLYVVEGYWQDGYVLDSENKWTEQSESLNTWIATNNSLNTWTEQSESSNTWVVIG